MLRCAMLRQLQLVISLVLFAAAMLVVRWALHAWVPDAIAWLNGQLGESGSAFLIFGAIATAGGMGVWLSCRDAGRQKELPHRR